MAPRRRSIFRHKRVGHRARIDFHLRTTRHRKLAQHGGKRHACRGRRRRGAAAYWRQKGDVCSNSHAKNTFRKLLPATDGMTPDRKAQ
jgi:hypothetical protein